MAYFLLYLALSYALGAALLWPACSSLPPYDRPWRGVLLTWAFSPLLLAAALVLVPATLLMDLGGFLVRRKGGA